MTHLAPSTAGRHQPCVAATPDTASAMCSSGTSTARSTAGATLCMRLVQMATVSAPPATQARAAAASSSPARSQSPAS